MLRRIIFWNLAAQEKKLGESIEYVRHIVRVSLPAFFRLAMFFPFAAYRRRLPVAPLHVARIVATRDEDCGTCVQIEVNVARKDGIAAEIIRAVLDDRPQDLPEDLADVYHFSKGVVEATYGEGALRERIRARYGEEGLIELAFAIASCRVFPVTKRALGYAVSCSRVEVRV